jgi:hypothetical protein
VGQAFREYLRIPGREFLQKLPPRAPPKKLLYINKVSISVCLPHMTMQRQRRQVGGVMSQFLPAVSHGSSRPPQNSIVTLGMRSPWRPVQEASGQFLQLEFLLANTPLEQLQSTAQPIERCTHQGHEEYARDKYVVDTFRKERCKERGQDHVREESAFQIVDLLAGGIIAYHRRLSR